MDDLEARLDALYAGPPGEFTAARTALAKELRDGGDREAAEEVGALRRPTKLAAELNRIAREEPDALAAAIAAEEALAETQRSMLAGRSGAGDLDAAGAAEAEAIAALSDDVEVRAAIRAAARRDDEREELRRGRLSRDPEPDLGAALFGGQAPPPPAPRRTEPKPKPKRKPAPEEAPPKGDELAAKREDRARKAQVARESALAEARELAAAAADNARRTQERADEAARGREVAERARDEAEAEVARLRDELADAQRESAARDKDATRAAGSESRARTAAEEAAGLVADAERVLAQLEDEAEADER